MKIQTHIRRIKNKYAIVICTYFLDSLAVSISLVTSQVFNLAMPSSSVAVTSKIKISMMDKCFRKNYFNLTISYSPTKHLTFTFKISQSSSGAVPSLFILRSFCSDFVLGCFSADSVVSQVLGTTSKSSEVITHPYRSITLWYIIIPLKKGITVLSRI